MTKNCKVSFGILLGAAIFALVLATFMPLAQAQPHDAFTPAPAPAPAPTSDGRAIDQGIACGLMLLALALTYLIHTIDVPFII